MMPIPVKPLILLPSNFPYIITPLSIKILEPFIVMKNRDVGFLMIGVSALIGFIIYSFNSALTEIVNTSCSHGPSCPMWGTINFQTNVSIALMAFVAVIGLYLVFFGKEQDIRVTTVEEMEVPKSDGEKLLASVKDMGKDAHDVLSKIVESDGTIFQAELAEKAGLSKVRVTRVLDKLEGRGIIERKRRGMTNVVILKHD